MFNYFIELKRNLTFQNKCYTPHFFFVCAGNESQTGIIKFAKKKIEKKERKTFIISIFHTRCILLLLLIII